MTRQSPILVVTAALLMPAVCGTVRAQPVYKGMSLTPWSQNALLSADSDQSIANMAAIGVDTVALNFWAFQDDQNATEIELDFSYFSASEASLVHAINEIHSHGMQVLLKPNVDLRNGAWRGTINPSNAWFNEYEEFMTYWGDFAEDNGVELLSIGTEYKNTESWDAGWRGVADAVRSVYSGPITYSANHDSYNAITWWDELDLIGIDAYFPLSSQDEPTLSQLTAAWQGQANTIEAWRAGQGLSQPVIFAEVGYRSVDDNLDSPWEFSGSGTIDLVEQENAYRALMSVMNGKDWYDGAFWWNWETDPLAGGPTNDGFTPQNKPVEAVISACYLGDDCGNAGGQTERTVLYSWENGLEGWFAFNGDHPSSVAQSALWATHEDHSLAVSQTVASAGANHFSWNAAVQMSGAQLVAMNAALADDPENYLLEFDITFDNNFIPQGPASWMNGEIAIQDDNGLWVQTGLPTTTGQSDNTLRVSLPLSTWASLDPASNFYLMVLAMNGNWGAGTATLFYDNLSLVDLDPDVAPVLLGDYNDNNVIDAADYTVWRDALAAGGNSLLNDPTPGTVDGSDFQYWRSHFGETLGGGASAGQVAVPEPASVLLAGLALGFGVTRRRRQI